MFNDSGGGWEKANDFYARNYWLAITLAALGTALLGPLVGQWTEDFAYGMVEQLYGPEWTYYGVPVWKGFMYLIVFFITRTFILAALMALAMGAATRFPMLMGI